VNEYQTDAFGQAAIFVVLLMAASCLYFYASHNKPIAKRLLVSAYPLIFIVGEVYALIGSSYYESGSWVGGEYVSTSIGAILNNGLVAIFAFGLAMAAYTSFRFEGAKILRWLAVLVIPVAALLFFISGMTLTRDWV